MTNPTPEQLAEWKRKRAEKYADDALNRGENPCTNSYLAGIDAGLELGRELGRMETHADYAEKSKANYYDTVRFYATTKLEKAAAEVARLMGDGVDG